MPQIAYHLQQKQQLHEEAARQSRESELSAYKNEMEAKAAERDSKLEAMKMNLQMPPKTYSTYMQ